MRKTIAIALVTAMFSAMVTALAAGTQADPLISKSYVDRAYRDELKTFINEQIAGDGAVISGVSAVESLLGYDFAASMTQKKLGSGDIVELLPGSSITMSSGSATVSFSSGSVINVSGGAAVGSGSALVAGERYFCASLTDARIVASAPSDFFVDGYHKVKAFPVISSDKFTLSGSNILGITSGLGVSDFMSGVTPGGFAVILFDATGVAKSGGVVATGDRLRVMDAGTVIREYTLVVTGDVTGSGSIALGDLLAMRRHLLDVGALTNHFYTAGDVNKDGVIGLQDLLMFRRHLLNIELIGK